MSSGVLETNTSTYTQSPADDPGLYQLIDIGVLVLRGNLVNFTHIKAAQTGNVQSAKQFGMTSLVAID